MSSNYIGSDGTVRVRLEISMDDKNVGEVSENIQAQISRYETSWTNYGETVGRVITTVGKGADDTGDRIRNALSPTRVASKDLWGLAYALRRLNITVFGYNESVKNLVDTMIALGAAFRVVSVASDIVKSITGAKTAVQGLSVAWTLFNAKLAESAFWSGLLTAGIATIAGIGTWALVSSMAPRSYATTGTVPSTGMYMLHKGEVYSEGGGPDYSQININIQTGAISSRLDVENIFKEMAVKMSRETRRRGS